MRSFHLPFLFIILTIAFQISIYLIYKYYQIRKEKLAINKFLIAFAILYGFGFSGIVIRSINSYYIEDLFLFNFLNNFSHILVFIAAFCFLLIVSQKQFNDLINRNVTIITALITVILSILIFLIKDLLIKGILFTFAFFNGGFYMFFFHIRLMQQSTGNVRNRILLILIAEIIIIISILIGAEKNPYLFTEQGQELVKVIFVIVVISCQILIFYGFYDFPTFLEFNWQENIIKLYILDTKRGKIIYSYNFLQNSQNVNELEKGSGEMAEDRLFFSSGIIGIEKIISSLTKTKEDKIQRISQDDQLILFNHGSNTLDFLTFCVLAKREMISTNYFLKMVKNRFQELYKSILLDLDAIEGKEIDIFYKFNKQIRNILKIS